MLSKIMNSVTQKVFKSNDVQHTSNYVNDTMIHIGKGLVSTGYTALNLAKVCSYSALLGANLLFYGINDKQNEKIASDLSESFIKGAKNAANALFEFGIAVIDAAVIVCDVVAKVTEEGSNVVVGMLNTNESENNTIVTLESLSAESFELENYTDEVMSVTGDITQIIETEI